MGWHTMARKGTQGGARSREVADDQLAALLATGLTVRDAAKRAGVAERTAWRRMEDAAFKARVAELRAALFADTLEQVNGGLNEAFRELRALTRHRDANVRKGAAT